MREGKERKVGGWEGSGKKRDLFGFLCFFFFFYFSTASSVCERLKDLPLRSALRAAAPCYAMPCHADALLDATRLDPRSLYITHNRILSRKVLWVKSSIEFISERWWLPPTATAAVRSGMNRCDAMVAQRNSRNGQRSLTDPRRTDRKV